MTNHHLSRRRQHLTSAKAVLRLLLPVCGLVAVAMAVHDVVGPTRSGKNPSAAAASMTRGPSEKDVSAMAREPNRFDGSLAINRSRMRRSWPWSEPDAYPCTFPGCDGEQACTKEAEGAFWRCITSGQWQGGSLNLEGMQLTYIPASIGRMVGLAALILCSNQITHIPPEIGQLTGLWEMILSDNQITSIPAEIGRLTLLERLDINDNQITAIPKEIGQMKFLSYWACHNNNITQLPAEIGNNTHLTKLYLQGNQLLRFPSQIGLLTNLERLEGYQNQITELPKEMGQLTKLRYLDLHGNQIATIPEEIGGMKSLDQLILNFNHINFIPASIFTISRMGRLMLHHNRLTGISVPTRPVRLSLTTLELNDNRISSIPAGMGNLTSIAYLRLQNNLITAIPSELGGLTRLRELLLFGNRISAIPPDLFTVILSANANTPESSPFPETIALHDNQITFVSPSLNSLASKMPQSLITMGGNPSVCRRNLGAKTDDMHQALICDCAPEFFGVSDCHPMINRAHQSQVFVSTYAALEVNFPPGATPVIPDVDPYPWGARTTQEIYCGGTSWRSWTRVVYVIFHVDGTVELSLDCLAPADNPVDDAARRMVIRGVSFKTGTRSEVTELEGFPISLVASAFQNRDQFPAEAPAVLTAEVSRTQDILITAEALGLPRNVRGNPNIPAIVSYSVELSEAGPGLCNHTEAFVVVDGLRDGSEAMLRIFSAQPFAPCTVKLYATEAETRERLHVTDLLVDVRDCYDRCGDNGICVDASGSLHDGGGSSCKCNPGYRGERCDQLTFDVTWAEDRLPEGFMGAEFTWTPASDTIFVLRGSSQVAADQVLYKATGLPCGASIDPRTGRIHGQLPLPGIFLVDVVAALAQDQSLITTVNGAAYNLTVVECHDTISCNGGACNFLGDRYDGNYTCDCASLRPRRSGAQCTDIIVGEVTVERADFPSTWPQAVFQKPYSLGDTLQPDVSGSDAGATTLTVDKYSSAGLPCGLTIDGATGDISGTVAMPGIFDDVTIVAEVNGRLAKVNQAGFSLEVVDCNDAVSCNGGRCVDDVRYDGEFTCDCNGTDKAGSFCEEEPAGSSSSSNDMLVIGVGAGAGSLVLLVALALIAWRVRVLRAHNQPLSFASAMDKLRDHGLLRAEDDTKHNQPIGPREIRRRCITVLEKIGEGAFGEVSKGFLDEAITRRMRGFTVALKVLKDESVTALQNFGEEAALMSNLHHKNVLLLLGVVTRGEPKMLVVEFCGNGDLKGFLMRMVGALVLKVQLAICHDVAKGMAYLSSRGLVHRDLAARNILIADDFTCKVSDFGLSRQLEGEESDYYRSVKATAIPVRWTAVEALEERKYTEKSDVWSFGVLMYEVFTAAATPYDGMNNQMVLLRVKGGYRLPCPEGCPQSLYNKYLASCWLAAPADRPRFEELATGLAGVAGSGKTLAQAAVAHHHRFMSGSEHDKRPSQVSASEYLDLLGANGTIIEAKHELTAPPPVPPAGMETSDQDQHLYFFAENVQLQGPGDGVRRPFAETNVDDAAEKEEKGEKGEKGERSFEYLEIVGKQMSC